MQRVGASEPPRVMAGLVPAIHAAGRAWRSSQRNKTESCPLSWNWGWHAWTTENARNRVDGRDKPGHDGHAAMTLCLEASP